MKKLALALVVAVTVIGAGVAVAAPTASQEQAYLTQYRADEARWAVLREDLDNNCIRPNLRPLIRDLLIEPVIEADTLAEARAGAQHALDVLAAPGPAESVSKTIHTCTRVFGSQGARILRRHIADSEDRLETYP